MANGVRAFQPVAHRLELVAEINGVSYYNDSIATTPERTLAGVHSFEEPIVLLVGGREKHLPLEEFAQDVVERTRAVVCFGEAGPLLEESLRYAAGGADEPEIVLVETLDEAVREAARCAQQGDVVLMSPACASYDAYDNFEQRGDDFRRIVNERAAQGGTEPSRSPQRAG
jgi:UDP-N-acetylmuramoylalanine--D-glutamate ligase